jgi:hypothetical protein
VEDLREVILKTEAVTVAGGNATSPFIDSRLEDALLAMQQPLIAEYARLVMLLELRKHPEVVARLKAMPFKSFVSTRYWCLVRAYMLLRWEDARRVVFQDLLHRRTRTLSRIFSNP